MSMISVQNLTFGYDGSAELLFEHASFQLDTDWRLGFVGRNGRGKTTFLRLLMGQYEYSVRKEFDIRICGRPLKRSSYYQLDNHGLRF